MSDKVKVNVQVLGGTIKQIEASTILDVKNQLGVPTHTATVNGNAQSDDYELEEYEFVMLSPAVKGGLI